MEKLLRLIENDDFVNIDHNELSSTIPTQLGFLESLDYLLLGEVSEVERKL